jgi:hypothetical protein
MKKLGVFVFGITVLFAPCGTALAAGGTATGQPTGRADSLQLAMTLYAGGIPLGKVDMDAKFTGGKYHVVSNLETSGVVNVFWQSEIQASSSGKLDAKKLEPELYTSFYTGHNAKHQEVSLTYENGYPAKLYANPPYSTRGFEVKPEEKKGTFDPLSAMLFITSGVGATSSPCDMVAPVYDGRRRYSIEISKIENITIKMDNGLYTGPGYKCEIIYRQISGFSPRVLREANFPKIYAWVAQVSNGGRSFVIPMRVWAKSQYGTIAAVATSLKVNGATPK